MSEDTKAQQFRCPGCAADMEFDPASGLEVSEFLEGYRTCTTSDFFNPASV